MAISTTLVGPVVHSPQLAPRSSPRHRYGLLPAPGARKTWFPEAWSDARCVDAVKRAVTEPAILLPARSGEFINCFAEVDQVRIKVRVRRRDGLVITAHPVDGVGVHQVKVDKLGEASIIALPLGKNREIQW